MEFLASLKPVAIQIVRNMHGNKTGEAWELGLVREAGTGWGMSPLLVVVLTLPWSGHGSDGLFPASGGQVDSVRILTCFFLPSLRSSGRFPCLFRWRPAVLGLLG